MKNDKLKERIILFLILILVGITTYGLSRVVFNVKYVDKNAVYLEKIYKETEKYIDSNLAVKSQLRENNSKYFSQIATIYYVNNKKIPINPKTGKRMPYGTVVVTRIDDGTLDYSYYDRDITIFGYAREKLMLLYDGFSKPFKINGQFSWRDLINNKHHGIMYGFDSYTQGGMVMTYKNYLIVPSALERLDDFTLSISFSTNDTLKSGDLISTFGFNIDEEIIILEKKAIDQINEQIKNGNNLFTATFLYNKRDNRADLYINGVFVANKQISLNHQSLMIGSNDNTVGIMGIMHNVLLYDRIITQNEIMNNHYIDTKRFDRRTYEKDN